MNYKIILKNKEMKRRRINNKSKISSGESEKTDYNLHIDGFEIFNFELPSEDIIEEIIEIGDQGFIIFNNVENGGDNKRSQTSIDKYINSSDLNIWIDHMTDILETKYPNLKARDMVVLKSIKGCQKQIAHCDYEQDISFSRCPDEHIPLGCLLSILPGTTLDVWPKSIRLPCIHSDLSKQVSIKRIRIQLKPGEILVFRGDLVHAGSAYSEDNYRIHTYLDSSLVKRNPNRTWYMNDAEYIQN